jgi:hypothetical protein
MAFDGNVLTLAGLLKIELPDHTIRLTDGGVVWWEGEKYAAEDDQFGTLAGAEAVTEQVNDEAPAGKLMLMPPSGITAADLFQPESQGSPVRFWLAQIDPETGLIVGTPELTFDGQIDSLTLRVGADELAVEIEFTSAAERLFMVREGNVLSPRFHALAWPGEKGFDHATDVQQAVPWGVNGQPRNLVQGLIGALFGGEMF